jgi:hypothetical protein
MELVWLLDRATALVAYPLLYAAVVTGIFYNTRSFGPLFRLAQRVHVPVSVLALVVTAGHVALGVADTWLVVQGVVPQPNYSTPYLLAGVVVGAGSTLLVAVAVLGFLDARRFPRPWGPRVVHAFAYGGYAFATVHAVAIGTDVVGLSRSLVLLGVTFVAYLLVVRYVGEWLVDDAAPAAQ